MPQERNSDFDKSVSHFGKQIVPVSLPATQVTELFIAAEVVRFSPMGTRATGRRAHS